MKKKIQIKCGNTMITRNLEDVDFEVHFKHTAGGFSCSILAKSHGFDRGVRNFVLERNPKQLPSDFARDEHVMQLQDTFNSWLSLMLALINSACLEHATPYCIMWYKYCSDDFVETCERLASLYNQKFEESDETDT